MTINYTAIGQRIRTIRKREGISQSALSEMIDKSPTYLSYIEGGIKSMSLETFVQVANALKVSADDLLVDNLVHNQNLSHFEFQKLFSDCSEIEKAILLDVITATKHSLRKHRKGGWSAWR